MQLLQAILLSVFFMGLSRATFDAKWGSEPNCECFAQSPIDIVSASAIYDYEKADVQFNWEVKPRTFRFYLRNDGETLSTVGHEKQVYHETTIVNGKTYILYAYNFHWGEGTNDGSEHSVDGKKYAGEIEFVFKLRGQNRLEEALKIDGGFLLVSTLLELDASMSEDVKAIKNLKSSIEYVNRFVSKKDVGSNEYEVDLEDLKPGNDFFRYTGSFSFTPCTQKIERIVFKDTLKITSDFLTKLRTLKKLGGGVLSKSINRRLQHLNDRPIYTT